jgi:hypothetical protein
MRMPQTAPHGISRQQPTVARTGAAGLLLKVALTAGILSLAAFPMAYILWPRWPDQVALDAPALPITVGGLWLNVPPATIRNAAQRRSGAHERIDLVFLWPSLTPPDPAAKPMPAEAPTLTDRVFVTVAASDATPPPAERLKTIYPRYTAGTPKPEFDGLMGQAFRNDTPYRDEDLFYDASVPERFLVRCTRNKGPAFGVCLHERRIGTADFTARFPRDWLTDWRAVAAGIDRLISGLRPNTSK